MIKKDNQTIDLIFSIAWFHTDLKISLKLARPDSSRCSCLEKSRWKKRPSVQTHMWLHSKAHYVLCDRSPAAGPLPPPPLPVLPSRRRRPRPTILPCDWRARLLWQHMISLFRASKTAGSLFVTSMESNFLENVKTLLKLLVCASMDFYDPFDEKLDSFWSKVVSFLLDCQ